MRELKEVPQAIIQDGPSESVQSMNLDVADIGISGSPSNSRSTRRSSNESRCGQHCDQWKSIKLKINKEINTQEIDHHTKSFEAVDVEATGTPDDTLFEAFLRPDLKVPKDGTL